MLPLHRHLMSIIVVGEKVKSAHHEQDAFIRYKCNSLMF